MFISTATVRAWRSAVWQWLVNAASTCRRKAQPGASYAWETVKVRFSAAVRQAIRNSIDDLATAAKEAL
jgi:hypothetical protein